MKNEKWDFRFIDIENMIYDYYNITKSEELKNHIYDFIQEAINRTSYILSAEEVWELVNKLNR